ncbi:hypothetical protein V8C40DRAFT_245487 [Trichoderma camerunense]
MLSYCINGFHGIHFGALPPVGTLESSTIECTCMYSILVIGSDGSLIQHHLRRSRLAAPDRYLTVPPDASPNSVLMSQVHLAQSPLVPSTSMFCLCLV